MNSKAVAAAAGAARRDLAGARDDPTAASLNILLSQDPQPPAGAGEALWALAGLHVALHAAFAKAWEGRGRAVIQLTFQLHALLGHASAQGYVEAEVGGAPLPKAYAELLREMGKETSSRVLVLRWIDLYHQRLTLHRYSNASQRRSQARLLFIAPLELLKTESKELAAFEAETISAIEPAAEQWLGAWDLLHAAELAGRGWNRIELPHGRQMGGFFGLADEARPPTGEMIQAAAESSVNVSEVLLAQLAAKLKPIPWLAAATVRMHEGVIRMLAALAKNPKLNHAEACAILSEFIGPHAPAPGMWRRFKDLLTSRD